MLRLLLTYLLLHLCLIACAQCEIQLTNNKVCLGAISSFSPTRSTVNDSAWVWNFGDGNTSFIKDPAYQYSNIGLFQVNLRTYYKGGTYCDAAPISIRVVAKPIAEFLIDTASTQCFELNTFRFVDLSKPGISQAPIFQKIFLFDDGAFMIQQAPFDSVFKHSYLNTTGGKFRVILEVKDTNGCIDQYYDSVFVRAKFQDPEFNASLKQYCNYTEVVFTHNNIYNFSNTNKIIWKIDSTDEVNHQSSNQLFRSFSNHQLNLRPVLIIKDQFGCKRFDTLGFSIEGISFDTILFINAPLQCRINIFELKNNTNPEWLKWSLKGTHFQLNTINKNNVGFSIPMCDTVNVTLEITKDFCHFAIDTQLIVTGPTAGIRSNSMFQCEPNDTNIFNFSYENCSNNTTALKFLWNFHDDEAPPCIRDTRNNLNVGVNCNFTVDTVDVWHYYSKKSDQCYFTELIITDTITNCAINPHFYLAVTPVNLHPDSTANPPRKGIVPVFDLSDSCFQKVFFNFDEIVPNCGPQHLWFLPDSICDNVNWINVYTDTNYRWYDYSNRCTNDRKVTYGVAGFYTQNGQITCWDTSWFTFELPDNKPVKLKHHIINNNSCKPFDVLFHISDSVNYGIATINCNFGDGSINYQKNYTNNDAILESFTHTYIEPGLYYYYIEYYLKSGCVKVYRDSIFLGKKIIVNNTKPIICYPDSADISVSINYWGTDSTLYWSDVSRAQADKEVLYWNFGDDTTWFQGPEQMSHFYSSPNIYQISLRIKDSTHCEEIYADSTLTVVVSQINLKPLLENDTFFCAPTIISYFDSSYVQFGTTTNYTAITNREWSFGEDRINSVLQNPVIYYDRNGKYQTQLNVKDKYGCSADTILDIMIVGPEPLFDIIGDTFGCAPFTVKLRNQTQKKLVHYIWYFNDPSGSTFSTTHDSDVVFTYGNPGVYKIDLVGEDQIFNTTTSTFFNCSNKFPYLLPDSFHSRQITVIPTDTLKLSAADSLCKGDELTLTALGTNQINRIKLTWGDGSTDSASINEPIKHAYLNSGLYKIIAESIKDIHPTCVVDTSKFVQVLRPQAQFELNLEAFPKVGFKNQSQDAIRYYWDFGNASSTNNFSVEKDPFYTYPETNERFIVCLSAFDELDCMDSICKEIPIRTAVKIPNVFTPDNNDNLNDAFDIEIMGHEKYMLYIYNRWGNLVFESTEDGIKNDGNNWNGNNRNDGEPCPDGVYYVIFKYKFISDPQQYTYHGTVTLIRAH